MGHPVVQDPPPGAKCCPALPAAVTNRIFDNQIQINTRPGTGIGQAQAQRRYKVTLKVTVLALPY